MNSLVNRLFRVTPMLLAVYWTLLFLATHYPRPPVLHVDLWLATDKLIHCLAYAGLAMLLAAARTAKRSQCWRDYLLMGLLLAAYGVVDELTQIVPMLHREGDAADWLADLVGIVLGLGAFAALAWVARRWLNVRLHRAAAQ